MVRRRAGWAMLALLPGSAAAHSFGLVYNLPLPLWMYVYGAAAALVLSFLVAAWFLNASSRPARSLELGDRRWVAILRRLRLGPVLKAGSLLALLLCMISGFAGADNPYTNINMTLFWILFVLVYAYLTALLGDIYGVINPWRALAQVLDRLWPGYARGCWTYPSYLAYWPALGFYFAFICIELFAFTRPLSLAVILAAYAFINLAGVWLVGAAAWFRHCEFFGLYFHLLGKLAPFEYRPDLSGASRLRLRAGGAGALEEEAGGASLLLFLLFMLSSTAFDGLHETTHWMRWFWVDLYQRLQPWLGSNPFVAYPQLAPWYLAWSTLCLAASPFIYAGVYLFFIRLSRAAGGSPLPVRVIALRFAPTLLPIVLVYNLTHYCTLILSQGTRIVSLASDPLGRGWNLFGTAWLLNAPIIPDAGTVWHSQVALIVAGHIFSVYLAHLQALRSFPSARAATLSQLPMLVLMILFTGFGLWILAQPIKAGI